MLKQIDKPAAITFIPVISVGRDLDELAKEFKWKVFQDQDDLGPMRCAYLETKAGTKFVVFQYAYRSSPKGIVDIAIPSGLDNLQVAIRDIVESLKLGDDDFAVREVRYEDVA